MCSEEKIPPFVPSEELSKIINYTFKNTQVLKEALTHPSVLDFKNNERLEFLGDGILNMAVSDMLYKMYPQDKDGDLSRRKQELVSGKTVAAVGAEIKISDFIFTDAANNGDGTGKNTVENAVEALIGAIYVDGGYRKAFKFINTHWKKLAMNENVELNPKSALQAWTQKNGLDKPKYVVVKTTGPDHLPTFTISTSLAGVGSASATDVTKRAAEQAAAKQMLDTIQKNCQRQEP